MTSIPNNIKFWHCFKDNSNKIWGHFTNGDQSWVFWGAVGANWTFKNHGPDAGWDIAKLALSKENKSYLEVDLDYINTLDPLWESRFVERFVFFSLGWG